MSEAVTIKIKYLKNIEPIEAIKVGDWIDLRTAEYVVIEDGDFRMIPLGIAVELPKGYEAIVAPRSSTFKKYHIIQTNSIGIIDESYCGDNDEWMLPVYCCIPNGVDTDIFDCMTYRRGVFIPKNTRIAQFRIIKHQPEIKFEVVESLGNKDRGGFGSTGEK